MPLYATLFTNLSDKVFAYAIYETALQMDRAKRSEGGGSETGGGYGIVDDEQSMCSTTLYTTARSHQLFSIARVGLATGATGLALKRR